MIDPLLKRLRHYDEVTAEEEDVLRAAAAETLTVRRFKTIVEPRTELSFSTLLVEGLVHSFKVMRDGSRQTVQLAVPGDFIDLHSLTMKEVDHNLVALSDCVVAKFPHERLKEITRKHDHLTRLLWLSTTIDGAIEREMITSLGARSAVARLAHFFCELQARLEAVGIASACAAPTCSYDLKMNQEELANFLGMTPVHVNRMLKELRERGLLTFRGHIVEISDWRGLVTLAEFDPFYLGLRRRPR